MGGWVWWVKESVGYNEFKNKHWKSILKCIFFIKIFLRLICFRPIWIYLCNNFGWHFSFESGKLASLSFKVEKLIPSSKDSRNGLFNICHISPTSNCQVWWWVPLKLFCFLSFFFMGTVGVSIIVKKNAELKLFFYFETLLMRN